MKNKGKDDIVQSLEKFRTDQSAQPQSTGNQPFVAGNDQRKRWIKNLSISVVFILIFSISVTVYANYDRMIGSNKESSANKQTQVTTPSKKTFTNKKKGSPEAGEAFHLEFKEKIVGDAPKKKLSSKQQVPTRLSPPPQPKNQDKPAKNDTPIQIPADYKERLQNEDGSTMDTKKKK